MVEGKRNSQSLGNFHPALGVCTGVENIQEALKKLEPWTLKGVAGQIECPFLLTHGEADAQVPTEDARKEFAVVGSKDKTLKIFTREEGGSEH